MTAKTKTKPDGDTAPVRLEPSFYQTPIQIDVAGCGGTGSHILTGLARLDRCLEAVGHPGLIVTAWDPDRVEDANIGRQTFTEADVGFHKADVLINRINMWFGTSWTANGSVYSPDGRRPSARLLIGCVDSGKARAEIAKAGQRNAVNHWIDCGNEESFGQIVWGNFLKTTAPDYLPHVLQIYNDIEDDDAGARPSCTVAESLGRQGPIINQMMAGIALDALWRTIRSGIIEHCIWYFNMARPGFKACTPAQARAMIHPQQTAGPAPNATMLY